MNLIVRPGLPGPNTALHRIGAAQMPSAEAVNPLKTTGITDFKIAPILADSASICTKCFPQVLIHAILSFKMGLEVWIRYTVQPTQFSHQDAGFCSPGRMVGGASRDRTDDLIVANDALSQLSYSPTGRLELYLDHFSSHPTSAPQLQAIT
jgi:hypothetical protein